MVLQVDLMTFNVAQNGKAVDMVKIGSKRRRTKAQMDEAHIQRQFEDITAKDNEAKLKEREEEVRMLQEQLNSLAQMNEKGIIAGQWMEEQIALNNIEPLDDGKFVIT